MNTMETDDNSSVNSFSLVEDDQNKTTVIESDTDESFHGEGCKLQAHLHLKDKNQREKFDVYSESPLKESSFVQVTKVRYLDSFIRVFTNMVRPTSVARCFYHEPLVVLDRSSIVSESNELLKKDLVRFKIKMWDAEIRAKVLERLRSLPSLMPEERRYSRRRRSCDALRRGSAGR